MIVNQVGSTWELDEGFVNYLQFSRLCLCQEHDQPGHCTLFDDSVLLPIAADERTFQLPIGMDKEFRGVLYAEHASSVGAAWWSTYVTALEYLSTSLENRSSTQL